MADANKDKDMHSDPHAPAPRAPMNAPAVHTMAPKVEAKPAPVKEAHEMSFEEFKASKRGQAVVKATLDSQSKDAGPEKLDRMAKAAVRTEHRDSVRVAFQRGDVVAPAILAEYPDAFDGTVDLPASFIFGDLPVTVRKASVAEQLKRPDPAGAELYSWTATIKGNQCGSFSPVTASELVPAVSEYLKNAHG